MRYKIIGLSIIGFLFLNTGFSFGQGQYSSDLKLNKADSIKAMSIKELKLPESYLSGKKSVLPWKLNNAELKYFRPIFAQDGASCGQASGVAYNFTYEINCARGLDASLPENQYPTQFAWNFMNGGSGWRGVSYFHSFDLLEACGTPNVSTYGGMSEGGDLRWMSGYDEYYSALENRISEVNYIDVSSVDGLLTLKHWLNDHLNGSEFGGVASYYSSSPYNHRAIPEESPEAGKRIIVDWVWPAVHAMTIVGYNDSIRYDWNGDGMFTNDIDINNDDIVDLKDWEIGAFLFANSYGEYWVDSGFCYMMYRTLAADYENGGVWNNAVHVLKVKENYSPLLTMRVKLRHNSREKIKIVAGVSSDIMSFSPDYSFDFPLINFQGGNRPMQGLDISDTLDTEIMEVELDVTPLLGYVNAGESAKYFLQIIENDIRRQGWGEILEFSLIERNSVVNEIVFQGTPLPINNNSITTLSVVSDMSFEETNIITEELPVWTDDGSYHVQMEASGGQSPYKWDLLQNYSLNRIEAEFPQIEGGKLTFSDQDVGHAEFELAFPFPYYGDTMHTVIVALDGLVSFEGEDFAYPYYYGETTLLTDRKVIAPFMANLWLRNNNENGVWVKNTSEYFEVIWNATYNRYNAVVEGDFNFALRLYPNGKIETYYGDFNIPSYVMWVAGVSKGDKANYTENKFAHHLQNPGYSTFEFGPSQIPDYVDITEEGVLSAAGVSDDIIYNLCVQVEDANRISDEKVFQLSSGMIFSFEISSGTDDRIDFYDTTSLALIAKNISSGTIEGVEFLSSIDDEYVSILKNGVQLGDFAPGQTKIVDSSLVFRMEEGIPDQYNLVVESQIFNGEKLWTSDIFMTVAAMTININELTVENENNGFLEPGETADLIVEIQNLGHALGRDLNFRFVSNSNYLTVHSDEEHIDLLSAGEKTTISFNVSTLSWTPYGYTAPSVLELFDGTHIIQTIQLPVTIGKVPVLLLKLADGPSSADNFSVILDSLQLQYEYRTTFPEDLNDYYSVFVCLGPMFINYELSWGEGNSLQEFLLDGGRLYMEGMTTWYDDAPIELHSMFNMDVIYNGNYFEFDSVYGVEEEFTNGLIMGYSGSMAFNNYYFEPKGDAFSFLRTSVNDSACAVANDTLNYKTIGSSVLFGAMEDTGSSFSVSEYVNAILKFFDITIQVEGVAENDLKENALHFEVYPNPFTNRLSIQFYSSGEENPVYEIYDLYGRLIKSEAIPRIDQNQSVEIIWDGTNEQGEKQQPGIYFINYVTTTRAASQKVILR